MQKEHYLTLPDGNKFPLFKEKRDSKPGFFGPFINLWELLYDVGEQDHPIFSGVIRSFPRPQTLTSRLTGIPGLVDPTSVAKIYSFTNQDLSGPIVNNGYELSLYNNLVSYEIKWKARNNSRNFIIGFYRSNGYVNDNTNKLSLICGNLGASLFKKQSGKFICPGITNLYVACNKDTIIDMHVTAIIPKEITIPLITRDHPYVKYMVINKEGERYKVPVYEIFVLENNADVVKRPTTYFFEASKVIQNYLRETGLSITLIPDEPVNNRSIITRQIQSPVGCSTCAYVDCDANVIGTITYQPSSLPVGTISTQTNNVCDRCYEINGNYYGIKIYPPVRKVPRISFSVLLTFLQPAAYNFKAICRVQYMINNTSLETYKVVDDKGQITSQDAEVVSIFIAPYLDGNTIDGSFRIPETATDFLVTFYFESLSNPPSEADQAQIQTLREYTKFNKIRIDYENRYLS